MGRRIKIYRQPMANRIAIKNVVTYDDDMAEIFSKFKLVCGEHMRQLSRIGNGQYYISFVDRQSAKEAIGTMANMEQFAGIRPDGMRLGWVEERMPW